MNLNNMRTDVRTTCNLAINACTLVENREGKLVDISTNGAQIRTDRPYAQGTLISVECDGDIIAGTVAWTEIDRMGVKFSKPLTSANRLGRVIEESRRRQVFAASNRVLTNFGRRVAHG